MAQTYLSRTEQIQAQHQWLDWEVLASLNRHAGIQVVNESSFSPVIPDLGCSEMSGHQFSVPGSRGRAAAARSRRSPRPMAARLTPAGNEVPAARRRSTNQRQRTGAILEKG